MALVRHTAYQVRLDGNVRIDLPTLEEAEDFVSKSVDETAWYVEYYSIHTIYRYTLEEE